MGGSTAVPLSQRIPTFLETVPVLLETLGVAHMTLVSHSAGTLYALNALDHLRKFLDPASPSIALVGETRRHHHHDSYSAARLTTTTSTLGPQHSLERYISDSRLRSPHRSDRQLQFRRGLHQPVHRALALLV